MPIFPPLANYSGFRIDAAMLPTVTPDRNVLCRRRCPDCSDEDWEVLWFGDRTCYVCNQPVGVPA